MEKYSKKMKYIDFKSRKMYNASVKIYNIKRGMVNGHLKLYKIISFIIGVTVSLLIFNYNNNGVNYSHVKYKDSIIFKEKQLEEGCLPLFVQPVDSDKLNLMNSKDKKSFEDLMIKYLYVPVEEEGLIYAIIASNKFKMNPQTIIQINPKKSTVILDFN